MNAAPDSTVFTDFSPDRLEQLSDGELDALPFGIIGLDRDGRIARYNNAEARFARLDRSQVVGRSFFLEIARCAATPEFQGRFDRLLTGDGPAVVRFPYVFQFRFGAQQVDLELGRTSSCERVYVALNRRKFLPRQVDFPAALEAPLIRELEPEAERLGVRRDDQGRRQLAVESTMFEALFGVLAGTGEGERLARAWGTSWGRLAVVDLETEALQAHERSLSELPMTRAVELVAAYFERQQLGRLTFDFAHAKQGAIVLRLERSAFAEATPERACVVMEGLLARILSHMARRRLAVREGRCCARGAPACELIGVAVAREDALTARTATHVDAVDVVVRALAEEA